MDLVEASMREEGGQHMHMAGRTLLRSRKSESL